MLSQGRCIQLGFIRCSAGRWEIDERPETQRTRFAGCTERELAEPLWLAEALLGGHYGPLDEYLPEVPAAFPFHALAGFPEVSLPHTEPVSSLIY